MPAAPRPSLMRLRSARETASNTAKSAQAGDENRLSVRRKLQAVGPSDVGVQGPSHTLAGYIDDGNSSVLGVRDPELFAVRRYVKTFGASAHGDDRFVPIRCSRA